VRLRRLALVLAAAAALAAPLVLAAPAVPPAPDRWVTDQAGVLSTGTRDALDRRLEAYQGATGHQVIVWIGQLPEGAALEDFAVRAFAAWGIGRQGHDDGAALFLFPAARRVRIEVGYGLEGQLTDLVSARIIRERLAPRLQQGDWNGAVTAAVDGILGTVGGEPGAPPARAVGEGRPLSKTQLVLFGILGLLVLGFLVTHPSLAVYLLFSIFSGGGRGGGGFSGGGSWGGGGGGFSGGGGRSGGGGASGSW
jgi:uncharacterized protein